MNRGILELEWLASLSASCLHCAEAIGSGRARNLGRLAQAIHQPALELADELRGFGLPSESFWQHLIPLTVQEMPARELVARTLHRSIGRYAGQELLSATLTARLGHLFQIARRSAPGLIDELDTRSSRLRAQWRAHGPALLEAIARQTDARTIPATATVIMVDPVCGGAGVAHLWCNSLRIEPLEHDPAGLPEVVRLAWLVAQLNHDLPVFSEFLCGSGVARNAALAMVAPTLAAAAELGLVRPSDELLARAILQWGLAPAADLAEPLSAWWHTYADSRPSWCVALAALPQVLDSVPS